MCDNHWFDRHSHRVTTRRSALTFYFSSLFSPREFKTVHHSTCVEPSFGLRREKGSAGTRRATIRSKQTFLCDLF